MCIEAEATILRKGSGVKGGNKALSLSDPTIVANKGKKPRSEGKGKQIVNSRKLPLSDRKNRRKTTDADPCYVCKAICGSDSDAKNKEEWWRCRWCMKWAHKSCGNVTAKYFECLMCWESD